MPSRWRLPGVASVAGICAGDSFLLPWAMRNYWMKGGALLALGVLLLG